MEIQHPHDGMDLASRLRWREKPNESPTTSPLAWQAEALSSDHPRTLFTNQNQAIPTARLLSLPAQGLQPLNSHPFLL